MALPLATTTVTIVETASSGDPYEDATPTTLATGVRAVIGSPSGRDLCVGGEQSIIHAVADVDGMLVTHTCQLIDETTGDRWAVAWVQRRVGLGLDHQHCGLTRVTGGAARG